MHKLKRLLSELSDAAKIKIKEKWRSEEKEITDAQMDYYIDMFERYSAKPVFPKKDIFQYKFKDLEKIIDANFSKEKATSDYKADFDLQQLDTYKSDLVYEGDGLVIVIGDLREKCIKYGVNQKWCISRKDASNMFYSYRYSKGDKVFYFVFDRDLPRSNPNHALVVLIDRDKKYTLADADNSGYSGGEEIPWSEIVSKQPKLKNLQHIFKPMPISPEDRNDYELIKGIKSDKAYIALSYDMKEKYISIRTDNLSLEQFKNTPPDLQKKYADIGHILTANQYDISPPQVRAAFARSLDKREDDDYQMKRMPSDVIDKLKAEYPNTYLKCLIAKGNFDSDEQIEFLRKAKPQELSKAVLTKFSQNDKYGSRFEKLSYAELKYMYTYHKSLITDAIRMTKFYPSNVDDFIQFVNDYFPDDLDKSIQGCLATMENEFHSHIKSERTLKIMEKHAKEEVDLVLLSRFTVSGSPDVKNERVSRVISSFTEPEFDYMVRNHHDMMYNGIKDMNYGYVDYDVVKRTQKYFKGLSASTGRKNITRDLSRNKVETAEDVQFYSQNYPKEFGWAIAYRLKNSSVPFDNVSAIEVNYLYKINPQAVKDAVANARMTTVTDASSYEIAQLYFPELAESLVDGYLRSIKQGRKWRSLDDWSKILVTKYPKKLEAFMKENLSRVRFTKDPLKWLKKQDPAVENINTDEYTNLRTGILPRPTRGEVKFGPVADDLIALAKSNPEEAKKKLYKNLKNGSRVNNWVFYVMTKYYPDFADAYVLSRYGAGKDFRLSDYQEYYADKTKVILRFNLASMKKINKKR